MSIYPPSHQPTNALNGIGVMSDGSGTINPAALNTSGTYFPLVRRPGHSTGLLGRVLHHGHGALRASSCELIFPLIASFTDLTCV
jgi:hypothetical protein